jgi:hypothetical protein
MYEGRLQSLCTHLITPSRNFVEVRWRSLFRSTFPCQAMHFLNVPLTSRKRASDRWSLRNFLRRSSLFMIGKAQKSHVAKCELYGGCSNRVPPIHFFQAEHNSIQITAHAISGVFQPWKGSSEARNFEMINGLQHIFEKWVERCKKFIACQGRYFERDRHRTSTKLRLGIMWIHELFKRPSYVCIYKCVQWVQIIDSFVTVCKLLDSSREIYGLLSHLYIHPDPEFELIFHTFSDRSYSCMLHINVCFNSLCFRPQSV